MASCKLSTRKPDARRLCKRTNMRSPRGPARNRDCVMTTEVGNVSSPHATSTKTLQCAPKFNPDRVAPKDAATPPTCCHAHHRRAPRRRHAPRRYRARGARRCTAEAKAVRRGACPERTPQAPQIPGTLQGRRASPAYSRPSSTRRKSQSSPWTPPRSSLRSTRRSARLKWSAASSRSRARGRSTPNAAGAARTTASASRRDAAGPLPHQHDPGHHRARARLPRRPLPDCSLYSGRSSLQGVP